MTKFNINKYNKSTFFICKRCSYNITHKKKIESCPQCGYHLFKVADRSGTPRFWDRDDFSDPYLRQRQKGIDPGSGRSQKLVNPFDEDVGGGLGTRVRGKGFPSDFSSEDTYELQKQMDIPGSRDNLLENPPLAESLGGDFVDPIDALSRMNMENNKDEGSIDKKLKKSRMQQDDDNIYRIVRNRQKR